MAKKKFVVKETTYAGGFGADHKQVTETVIECEPKDAPKGAVPYEAPKEDEE